VCRAKRDDQRQRLKDRGRIGERHVCNRGQESQRAADLADYAHPHRSDEQRTHRPQRAAPGGEGRNQHHRKQAAHQDDLADIEFRRHRLGDGIVHRESGHGRRHQQAASDIGMGVQLHV
jgi:hypothetical protein